MKFMQTILGIYCFLIFPSMTLKAQTTHILKLLVSNENKEQISRPELLIEYNDSIVLFSIIEGREKIVTLPTTGVYHIVISAIGYEPSDQKIEISTDTTLNVVMEQKVTNLSEVVVIGKRQSNFSATGEIFKISNKGKAMKDPYRALSEIPVLSVDIVGKSIKTRNGETPLILVDGRLVNTGISPILPSDIESVEVTEVVTARYLEQGYSKVVNIRLRPDRPTYTYMEGRTRHDIPLRQGSIGGDFELGRTKFAVFGSVFYNYLHKDRTSLKWEERQENLTKEREGEQISRYNDINGNINIKWLPTKDDYFSARFVFKEKANHMNSAQIGGISLTGDSKQHFSLSVNEQNRISDNGLLGAIFYQHTFKDKGTLDLYAHYNHGYAELSKSNEELWDDNRNMNITLVELNTIRNQYTFNADYMSGDHSYGTFELGNHFVQTNDEIQNKIATPSVKESISQLSNYTFATYQRRWSRFMLMASVGIQGLHVSASDRASTYFRPRTSESAVFLLNRKQAIRLRHVLTNTLPTSLQLGTFSTSSNPLLREEGNIHLRPNQKNSIGLSYNLSLEKWRFAFNIDQTWVKDIIEPYIFQQGERYVQTYRNNGTYKQLSFGPNINYRGNGITAMVGASVVSECFNEQSRLWSWQMNSNLIWWLKDNLGLTASFVYTPKSYTNISVTHYKNPSMADISVAWYPTDNIQISVGIPYIWGVREQSRIIHNSGYYQYMSQRFDSSSLRPFILFAYTFRKHSKLKIKNLMPENEL